MLTVPATTGVLRGVNPATPFSLLPPQQSLNPPCCPPPPTPSPASMNTPPAASNQSYSFKADEVVTVPAATKVLHGANPSTAVPQPSLLPTALTPSLPSRTTSSQPR